MTKTKIIVHCLVKNEDRFIYYAVKSVLPFVDRILIWDTGSTDLTVNIIKRIHSPKINFKEVGDVDARSFTSVRNQMLRATPKKFNWLLILDGDEVWPKNSLSQVISYIKTHPETESIVVKTYNLVGDIYHRLPHWTGRYHLAGHKGHLNLRFINLKLINGLTVKKPHGQQGYYDGTDRLIQERDPNKIKFLPVYYLHATHLVRSTLSDSEVIKRLEKRKLELGIPLKSSTLPRIIFQKKPALVPDITDPAPLSFWIKALLITPLKYLRLLLTPSLHGY